MTSNEKWKCEYGTWRTTKNSWVLDWIGTPPHGIKMGRHLEDACGIHRGIAGSTFFSYEKILMHFALGKVENWELVRPDTMIDGKPAWEHVLKNIRPRENKLFSSAHTNS